MKTSEKALLVVATLAIMVGAGLTISHTATYISGRSLMTGGYVLALATYGGYSRRLQAENRVLKAELQRLRTEG